MADYRVRIVVEGEDRASGPLGKVAGSLGRIGEFAAGSLLADGIKAVGSAVVGVGAALFDTAMFAADLNAQMSGIVALAGADASELENIKKIVSELAVNPNLVVSGTEATAVIQELIAGGLTLQDVYDGAAEATVLLANATGSDFTTSATVATDTMAIFGVKAENMMGAVNGITSVVNASKFDLNDYSLFMAQAGGVAAAYGVELDDLNATMVAVDSTFSSGSDAGTSFKWMLQSLVPKSKPAAESMYELGLLTTDYAAAAEHLSGILGREVAPNQQAVVDGFTVLAKRQGIAITDTKKFGKAWDGFIEDFEVNQFFDANGQLKDMGDIVGVLNGSLAGLSEQAKITLLNPIFGDGTRSVIALAQMTEQEFRNLQQTMGDTDALESARIRVNNLAGDMDIFSGVLEDVRYKVGDSFQPALRIIYQSATQLLTNLSPTIQGAVDGIAVYIEEVTPQVTTAIEEFAKSFSAAYTEVGGGLPGVVAGLGGTVKVNAEAEVTYVDFKHGAYTHTYDAESQVSESSVLWGAYTHTYNAGAQVSEGSVLWGVYKHTYNAGAQVSGSSVLWGAVTHTYDAKAEIKEGSLLWGVHSYTYDVGAQVVEGSLLWGTYTHVYNASAQVSAGSVLWGVHQHYYSAQASIYNVVWGGYTKIYNASAQVSETSVLWGLATHTYDAKANVTEVTFLGRTASEYWADLAAPFVSAAQGWQQASDGLSEKATGLGETIWGLEPQWLKDLTISLAPGLLESLILKPPSPESMLAIIWPEIPEPSWLPSLISSLNELAPRNFLGLGIGLETPDKGKLGEEIQTALDTTPTWVETFTDPPTPKWTSSYFNPPEPTWVPNYTNPPQPAWANKLTSIFDELDARTGAALEKVPGTPDEGKLGEEIQTALDTTPAWTSSYFNPPQPPWLPTYTAPPAPAWIPTYTNPPAPTWLPSLTSIFAPTGGAYNALGPGTLPGTVPGTAPPPAAEKIDWSSYIPALDWGSVVSSLDWAGFVSSLSWAGFVSSLSWGSYVKSISWGSFIPSISWGSFIPSINWSSFIPAAAGGGGGTGQASGTNFWRGGLTWVGEKGAELVSLPRGSTVYNHERSMAMAGMGGGGITMQNTFVVNSELDIEAAAYRILDVIRRHR